MRRSAIGESTSRADRQRRSRHASIALVLSALSAPILAEGAGKGGCAASKNNQRCRMLVIAAPLDVAAADVLLRFIEASPKACPQSRG